MSDELMCPRRAEGFITPGPDHWRVNPKDRGMGAGLRACSFCGSMHPEDFFKAIEDGKELGPTDKNYKVYVGKEDLGKFYFQHLSADDQKRFIALLNDGKVKIGYPGYFYVLPYFVTRGPKP